MSSRHRRLTVGRTDAPAAIGSYSQAIKAGDLLFASGCIPLVPSTMQIVQGGIVEQTEQALANLKAVVEASRSDIGRVAKTTVRAMNLLVSSDWGRDVVRIMQVFLKDMGDFVVVNGIYAKFFGDHKPARSAVEVA